MGSTSNDELSPLPHFSPVFSPVFSPPPFVRTETTITPRGKTPPADKTDKQAATGTGSIEIRLKRSSVDLTGVTSPSTQRRSIVVPDLSKDKEQTEKKQSTFHFPIIDETTNRVRRRSSSRNRDFNRLKIE
jgi:hypothetical protein